jgi:AcrR family transcriptional regulator
MVQQRARRLPAAKRRRQIIESAREVFASQGYARVGTADLAKAAGISEPALYRHFAGKKELFLETIRSTGPRLLNIWEEISADYDDPIDTLRAIGSYYYDHLESHAANMKLQWRAMAEADDPEIRDALRENFDGLVTFIAETLEEGKTRGAVRQDVDSRMAAWNYLANGMMMDLMHILGFADEMDRSRADRSRGSYLESVKRRDGKRSPYASGQWTVDRTAV